MNGFKSLLISTLATTSLLAVGPMSLPKTDFVQGGGMSLKVLMSKPPQELDPNLCVLIGSAYLEGSLENGIQKSPKKGEAYLKYAGENGVALADALLANHYLLNRDLDRYARSMQRVVFSGDEKIAVPAGILLGNFYSEIGQIPDSVRVLRYVAERYGDTRAQFLAGYAILSGEYSAPDVSKRDGEFLIYQACTNPKSDPAVMAKCTQMGIKE